MNGTSISRHLTVVSLAAFGIVGCTAAQEEDTAQNTADLQGRRGVDTVETLSPGPLTARGYTFAVRYLSYAKFGKNITRAEADALRHGGVDVVSNWEWSGTDALGGYARGVEYARAAAAEAAAAGAPPDRPIYFSIDFAPLTSQYGAVDAYFDGIASVLGRARTGAYGGYDAIKHLFDTGRIRYGWQTFAWSNGRWDPRAQLRQVSADVSVGPFVVDGDVAMADDFGQWGRSGGAQLVIGNCTAEEKANASKFGCDCADHHPSGLACDGSGCSAEETQNAAKFGCGCVDHKGSGGFCAGSGCTFKETQDAAKFGCGCVDHKGSGGFCPGTGCTARETIDCEAKRMKCAMHTCKA